jgi:flavin reductase (DIM6/NTAB) family NADH-FMN oxidoreductase RutF
VVGIGTCSGADTDKFARFRLTTERAKLVKAPLIKECLANVECKVIDIAAKHNNVMLEGVAPHVDSARKEKRTVLAVGDGTFIVDGRRIDCRKMMGPVCRSRHCLAILLRLGNNAGLSRGDDGESHVRVCGHEIRD